MGNLPRVPYEEPPPWAPGREEPGRTQEEKDRRKLADEEQRRIDREAEQEDADGA